MPDKPAPRSNRAPTDIDRSVGERVRKLRLQRNYTLSELSAELGISHQQLQKYETGANRFSAGMLWSVSQVLGVTVSDLFPSAGPSELADAQAAKRKLAAIAKIMEPTQ